MRLFMRHERAQALVEFALILPVLVLILMGIIDLGRGIYAYSVVASAAREGAHYGILHPGDTTGISNQAKANTAGLDPGQVTVTSSCAPCEHGGKVQVTVRYTFQPVTGLFPSLTLSSQSTMTIE
jgi:Flp pilus assembly protein TadG